MDILSLVLQAGPVVQTVLLLLLVLSFVSWLIIFHLGIRIFSLLRADAQFKHQLSKSDLVGQFATINKAAQKSDLEQIFYDGFLQITKSKLDAKHRIKMAEHAMQVQLTQSQGRLEKHLPTLVNIGSLSPYIGLFGTVWGIMQAFMVLGPKANLALVTPSIAEALIATALGLMTAIPAAFFFNFYTTKLDALYQDRALFCENLLNHLSIFVHSGSDGWPMKTKTRFDRPKKPVKAEINIVPYIDVLLVLLVIALVASPMLGDGFKIDLPKQTAKTPQSDQPTVIINLKADGGLLVSHQKTLEQTISHYDLRQLLAQMQTQYGHLHIIIQADDQSPYGQIVQLLALVQDLGIEQVSLLSDDK